MDYRIEERMSPPAVGEDERRAAFDRLITGEYRDLFEERLREGVDQHLRAQRMQSGQSQMMGSVGRWSQEAEELKGIYPGFDLAAEARNPQNGRKFLNMLRAGVDMRSAYEALHRDDILGGAMQYTADRVREKMTNDIRARGMRPAENGVSGANAAVTTKTDPAQWSRQEMEDVIRRVRAGERIVL